MKKIYWIGDMINNTGPAIVNKSYYPYLKDYAVFCLSNNKIYRVFHFLANIINKKTIIISGFSKLNYYLFKIAKFLGKNTIYIMHGYIKEESKYLTGVFTEKIVLENKWLHEVDYIVCVSEIFCNNIKSEFPEISNKILFVNNGVNQNKEINKSEANKFTIISVGANKRKNNLAVCKAIRNINENIKFIVIGSLGQKEILEYDFVEYYESLSHDEVLNKMSFSNLYIQNSYFETFGLAVVEALQSGCNLLISKNVGALSILENITSDDIIEDNEDIDEITKKIVKKMKNPIMSISYNTQECSWENRSKEILDICR